MKTTDANLPVVYNVEHAVGLACANSRGDVILVEYLLREIYPAATGELPASGVFSAATIRWIKTFQADARRRGQNVMADGRVV